MQFSELTAQELAKSFIFGYNLHQAKDYLSHIDSNDYSYLSTFTEKLVNYSMSKMLIDSILESNEQTRLLNCVKQFIEPIKLLPIEQQSYLFKLFQRELKKFHPTFADEQGLNQQTRHTLANFFFEQKDLSKQDKETIVLSLSTYETLTKDNVLTKRKNKF